MSCSGGARSGQRGDERAQQLALARAGGAGDEGVRSVAVEVDVDGAPVGPDADGAHGTAAGGVVGIDEVDQADLPGEADGGAGRFGVLEPGRGPGGGNGGRLRARLRQGARASPPHRGSR